MTTRNGIDWFSDMSFPVQLMNWVKVLTVGKSINPFQPHRYVHAIIATGVKKGHGHAKSMRPGTFNHGCGTGAWRQGY